MWRQILKWTGIGLALILVVAAGLYATRSDPWGPISGRAVTGEVVPEPVADWSFTDEHMLIAVETRPEDPHSVTTVCFAHEGQLYVPAVSATGKKWPQYVLDNPAVRLKIGDKVYPARATRIEDEVLGEKLTAAARVKYDFPVPEEGEEPQFTDVWVFRMDSRIDVAAP